jgi:hypothetical protein
LSGSTVIAEEPATGRAGNRAAVRRGWILWLAAMVPAAAGLALIAASLDTPIPQSFGFRGFPALLALSFGSVGAFVVTRRPGNRVGLILVAIGINSGVLGFLFEYGNVGLVAAPGMLPGAIWVAWLASWTWVPLVILSGPLLLSVYPDGRFVSRRWRAVAFLGVSSGLLLILSLALRVGRLENFSFADNPIGVLPRSIDDVLSALAYVGLNLTFAFCAISLFVRFRTADRDGRQQLKWFAVAAFAMALIAPLSFLFYPLGSLLFIAALSAIPLATGLAVLRYGLYEIDTVIYRAIVYGLLTAVLAGIYTASIGVMQRLSKSFTGADSDAAIVVTTLLVVTAFTPIKGRLQSLVDRRFKENRDPAARLDGFVSEVRTSLSSPDTPRTLRRFLGVVVAACDLPGGRIELERPNADRWSVDEGEPSTSDPVVTVSAPLGTGTVSLVLSPSRRTGSISPRDRMAIDRALAAVVAELA